MPTYEFECKNCQKNFTLKMKIAELEKKKVTCPECDSNKVKKRLTAFQTKTSSKS
jgi:putative FmdB family regulatory protein